MALNYLQERLISSIQYVWNAKGENILSTIQRAREVMASQALESLITGQHSREKRATTQPGAANLSVRLNFEVGSLQPLSLLKLLAVAVTAIQQGASVEHAAQQHGIRDDLDMVTLRFAFNRCQQNPRVCAETLTVAGPLYRVRLTPVLYENQSVKALLPEPFLGNTAL
jgi:hypothetical protein